ncbi:MAG: CobW family GTP-binding protein [Bradymonadia bacterium]
MATPVNIISGFLGTGKTTALRHLLARKPESERWAIIVNEFGEVGIDGAMLEGSPGAEGVQIKELPGGCICCTAGVMFQLAVVQVMQQQKPDRLLIEPTGLATLQSIIDTFHGAGLRDSTEVRSVITLIDPAHWASDRHRAHETYQSQVQAADVLLASRADLSAGEFLERFHSEAATLFPPKQHIGEVEHGHLDLALLDLARPQKESHQVEATHHHHDDGHHDHHHHDHDHHHHGAPKPAVEGAPHVAHGDEAEACGWVLPHTWIFNWQQLMLWIDGTPWAERIKGVLRTERGWIALNVTPEDVSTTATAHRRDSRIEVIAAQGVSPDWEELHGALLACRVEI